MWECQRVVYSAYKPFKKSPWWQNGKKWHFLRRHFNILRYEVFITTGVSGRENISGNQTGNRFPQALSIYELFFRKVMFESLVPYECGCASPFVTLQTSFYFLRFFRLTLRDSGSPSNSSSVSS